MEGDNTNSTVTENNAAADSLGHSRRGTAHLGS